MNAAVATTFSSFFIGFFGTVLDLFDVILTILFFGGTITFFGGVVDAAAVEPVVISMNFLFVLDIRPNPPNPDLLKSAGFMLWSASFDLYGSRMEGG